jgi:glycine/D-amino acid oxidase-like deaminating enzyme
VDAALAGELEVDVVVLGGGITGCAAALELARRGMKVALLEAGAIGGGATASDRGHICAGPGLFYTDAVARWGRGHARQIWEYHRENGARLRGLLDGLADDCGYRAQGGFVLVHDRGHGLALDESEDLLREDGFEGEFLDRYMLETRFDVTGFGAAYWASGECEVDLHRLAQALAGHARELGARVFEATPVLHLETSPRGMDAVTAGGRVHAGWAFLALGAALGGVVPWLAEYVTIRPETGVVVALPPGPRLPSPARIDRGHAAWSRTSRGLTVVTCRDSGEAGADGAALAAERVMGASRIVHRWSAERAFGPDGLPLIGPLPGLPLAVAGAYGGLGEAAALMAVQWAVAAMAGEPDLTPAPLQARRVLAAQGIPQ